MKKTKYYILIFILSLICTNKVSAVCTQKEMDEFKKIEDKYKITYEMDQQTKKYSVTFVYSENKNITYAFDDKINLNDFLSNTNISSTFGNISSGEYTLEIINRDNDCIYKTLSLKLPEYNNYADDPLCEGIEEFVLCQPTYDKVLDYDTFISRVNTYKKTKAEKEDEQIIVNEEENEHKMVTYIKENLVQIIIITIFITLMTITIIITINSARKSRRLE